MNDKVNHPKHYKGIGKCSKCGHEIEAIDITQHHNFCVGNSLKYQLRAGEKHEEGMTMQEKMIEDYKKSIWYITREIWNIQNGIYQQDDKEDLIGDNSAYTIKHGTQFNNANPSGWDLTFAKGSTHAII